MTSILFVGDVVGGLGPPDAARDPARSWCDELAARLRRRQRRERGRRPRDHAQDRRRALRQRRRRDHARQPRLPPPGDPPLPRARAADRPAGELPAPPARQRRDDRRAGRRAAGVVNLIGTVFLDAARSPFDEIESLLHEPRGQGRPRPRRPARRGDEREGRDGLVPRRPRHRGRRHPHARPDRRRARAARRHRLHDRRRHDRPARRRDRRQEGAGDRVAASTR